MKLNLTEEQFNHIVGAVARESAICPEDIGVSLDTGVWDDCSKCCAKCWREALESLIEKEVEEPLYKCPKCGKESTQTWWNASTKERFGTRIVPIEDTKQRSFSGCYYCCPKCGEASDKSVIEKVVKENEEI